MLLQVVLQTVADDVLQIEKIGGSAVFLPGPGISRIRKQVREASRLIFCEVEDRDLISKACRGDVGWD